MVARSLEMFDWHKLKVLSQMKSFGEAGLSDDQSRHIEYPRQLTENTSPLTALRRSCAIVLGVGLGRQLRIRSLVHDHPPEAGKCQVCKYSQGQLIYINPH